MEKLHLFFLNCSFYEILCSQNAVNVLGAAKNFAKRLAVSAGISTFASDSKERD